MSTLQHEGPEMGPENGSTIYAALVAAGVPVDSHESDLYAAVTPESRAIIASYPCRSSVRVFTNRITGGLWYDIPFAFDPYWDRRSPHA